MIISFAWTTPALLAGAKTMTRRDWKHEHAAKFTVGQIVDAWDRSPRTGEGRKVATIRITREPRRESTAFVGDDDFDREGFRWLYFHGTAEDRRTVDTIWTQWRFAPREVWVVEFEVVSDERSVDAPAAPDVRPAEGVDPESDPSASPREDAMTRGALGHTLSRAGARW